MHPEPENRRTYRRLVAVLGLVGIFGAVAVYQQTPISDKSGERLATVAEDLARREGERAGRADRLARVPHPDAQSRELAEARANLTAYGGRAREDWKRAFVDGYGTGYLASP